VKHLILVGTKHISGTAEARVGPSQILYADRLGQFPV